MSYAVGVTDPYTLQRRRLYRAIIALGVVLTTGTAGFVLTEGWSVWKSLYFTLITITTVGYGDEGVSEIGKRFTTVLLLGGIATATYAFGQIVQVAVSNEFAWRRRMNDAIKRLHGHFIICGMGSVGRAVCKRLAAAGERFVIIEANTAAFDRARESGCLALHGSATEDELLLQAGITRARGIVCAVDSDADNIVITLSARELNPEINIISRVTDEASEHKVLRAGASHAICPANNGGTEIANVLVRPHLAEFLRQSRHEDGELQMGEISVASTSALVGEKLSDYGMIEPSLVFVALKRANGETTVRPGRNATIAAGDVVIVAGDVEAICRMRERATTGGEMRVQGLEPWTHGLKGRCSTD